MGIRNMLLCVSVLILSISLALPPTLAQLPAGDFNGDQLLDCGDIDLLSAEIRAGTHNTTYDLDKKFLALSIPTAYKDVIVFRSRDEVPERTVTSDSTCCSMAMAGMWQRSTTRSGIEC